MFVKYFWTLAKIKLDSNNVLRWCITWNAVLQPTAPFPVETSNLRSIILRWDDKGPHPKGGVSKNAGGCARLMSLVAKFPSNLQLGWIISPHKDDDTMMIKNYWPNSFLKIFSKIFKVVICQITKLWIITVMEVNCNFSIPQHYLLAWPVISVLRLWNK